MRISLAIVCLLLFDAYFANVIFCCYCLFASIPCFYYLPEQTGELMPLEVKLFFTYMNFALSKSLYSNVIQ